jgi:diguanylate cyclase (GGDEF)-like protein
VKLSRLFVLSTLLLLTLVLIVLVRTMWQDLSLVRAATVGINMLDHTRRVMVVAEKASAERGPVIPVVNDAVPPDPAKRQRLTTFRATTDDAFKAAIDALAAEGIVPPASPPATNDSVEQSPSGAMTAAAQRLARAQQDLTNARAKVDRIAALPYAERTAPGTTITREPIDDMFRVIDVLLEGTTILGAQSEQIFPELSVYLNGARYAAELREYAGRLGSQFTTPLATQAPLGERERGDIPVLIGRINQLVSQIELRYRAAQKDDVSRAAIDKVRANYLMQSMALINTLTEAGTKGTPYGMDSARFVADYVPGMGSIVELRNVFLDRAKEGAQQRASAAKNRLITNGLIGLAILLVELAVLANLQLRVLRPMLKSVRNIVDISQDKFDVDLPAVRRTDEIGQMQHAVKALRAQAMKSYELEKDREQLIGELKDASLRDFLTGLPNRRALQEAADSDLARAARENWPVALILFDLDFFKSINDNYGHEIGDRVLKELAVVAKSNVREADLLVRYGGEEFAVLLVDCSPGHARETAERIRRAIESHGFGLKRIGDAPPVTSSFGIACAKSPANLTIDRLMREADNALYTAKANGRNCQALREI